MMPSRVGEDSCDIAIKWKLDPSLAASLVRLDTWAGIQMKRQGLPWRGLWIISGHRSNVTQESVNSENPNSLHTRCPALAVDLRVGNVHASITTPAIWAWLGSQWKLLTAGRWGGDFHDVVGAHTRDLNHFDLGVGPVAHIHSA